MAGGDVDLANRKMAEGLSTGLETAVGLPGGAGLLRAGAVKALPRLVAVADPAADLARANKISHIFGKPAHNLAGVSERLGGDVNAMRAIERATVKAMKGSEDGIFETTVRVAGENVVVRGTVVEGQARIGSAFIRKEAVSNAAR